MEKNIYLKDYLASRIISFNKTLESPEYGKIFYECNEDLVDTLKGIDFTGKDVLSVLASSDQVFTARYLKAKRVDAFDKNRLTLEITVVNSDEINKTFSTEILIKTVDTKEIYNSGTLGYKVLNNNNWLKTLLKEVKPQTEMEKRAYYFFQKHIEDKTILRNLFYDRDMQPVGRTEYQNAEELKEYKNSKLDFYELDLFEERKMPKQYDIVLVSNILEWARGDKEKLQKAARNLSEFTKKDGIVACSSLIFRKKEKLEEDLKKAISDERY